MAAKYNLQVDQMDTITAFLQGDLEEEICVVQFGGVPLEQDRRKSIEGNVPENFGRDGADDEIRVSGGRWMLTSFATTKGQRRQD